MAGDDLRPNAIREADMVGDHPFKPTVLDQDTAPAGSPDPALVEEVHTVLIAASAQLGCVQVGDCKVVQRSAVTEFQERPAVGLRVGDLESGILLCRQSETVRQLVRSANAVRMVDCQLVTRIDTLRVEKGLELRCNVLSLLPAQIG
jgi:hypothetical protein